MPDLVMMIVTIIAFIFILLSIRNLQKAQRHIKDANRIMEEIRQLNAYSIHRDMRIMEEIRQPNDRSF